MTPCQPPWLRSWYRILYIPGAAGVFDLLDWLVPLVVDPIPMTSRWCSGRSIEAVFPPLEDAPTLEVVLRLLARPLAAGLVPRTCSSVGTMSAPLERAIEYPSRFPRRTWLPLTPNDIAATKTPGTEMYTQKLTRCSKPVQPVRPWRLLKKTNWKIARLWCWHRQRKLFHEPSESCPRLHAVVVFAHFLSSELARLADFATSCLHGMTKMASVDSLRHRPLPW